MTMSTHPDGHPLLDGARWHTPKPGQPTVCVVPGCTRVLGQQQARSLVEDGLAAVGAGEDLVESARTSRGRLAPPEPLLVSRPG